MAKTFTDVCGNVVVIEKHRISFQKNTDVLTGKVTQFIIFDGDTGYEVTEEMYNATEKYVKE